MVRDDNLTTCLKSTWHARRIEYLTHQPKELVNQNVDINEWKRRRIFLNNF